MYLELCNEEMLGFVVEVGKYLKSWIKYDRKKKDVYITAVEVCLEEKLSSFLCCSISGQVIKIKLFTDGH